MKRIRLTIVLIAGLVGLTGLVGCGGSSDDTESPSRAGASPTAAPSPTTTSVSFAQMRRAIAAIRSLPQTGKVINKCPGGDHCTTTKTRSAWTTIALHPAKDLKPQQRERLDKAGDMWAEPSILVSVDQARNQAEEAKRDHSNRKRLSRYQGSFSFAEKRTGEHSVIAGETGNGEVHSLTRDGWRGLVAVRRENRIAFEKTSPPMQVAEAYFSAGTRSVLIHVNVLDIGRGAGEAADILDAAIDRFFSALADAT